MPLISWYYIATKQQENTAIDWIDLAVRFGLPTILLFGAGFFFVRRIWPFIVDAWENQQQERREERVAFLDSIKEERLACQAMIEAERETRREELKIERQARTEERTRFFAILDNHREQLEAITTTLIEIQHTIENQNGKNK